MHTFLETVVTRRADDHSFRGTAEESGRRAGPRINPR
jgi:hypothetical protein